VSTVRHVASLVALLSVAACGTPESTAWVKGVSANDAKEISALIRTQTTKPIDNYEKQRDGSIAVWMHTTKDDPFYGVSSVPTFAYVVRKVNGKWKIVDHHILVL
jgi:hypothetical protein